MLTARCVLFVQAWQHLRHLPCRHRSCACALFFEGTGFFFLSYFRTGFIVIVSFTVSVSFSRQEYIARSVQGSVFETEAIQRFGVHEETQTIGKMLDISRSPQTYGVVPCLLGMMLVLSHSSAVADPTARLLHAGELHYFITCVLYAVTYLRRVGEVDSATCLKPFLPRLPTPTTPCNASSGE